MTYKMLCKKIFTSEGYTFVQPNDFHILGKNISLIDDNSENIITLRLYENDDVFDIDIPYPDAEIWMNAISVYSNCDNQLIYCDFIEKRDKMIINNSEDLNNLRNILDLYKLLYPTNPNLDVVRYENKIYLTKGIF
jgi:hypothetical protein